MLKDLVIDGGTELPDPALERYDEIFEVDSTDAIGVWSPRATITGLSGKLTCEPSPCMKQGRDPFYIVLYSSRSGIDLEVVQGALLNVYLRRRR